MSKRRRIITPFMVMDIMRTANERAAAGRRVIHLEVGQPSTSAPRAVLDAAVGALSAERLGYTESGGISVLRRRIAQHYQTMYGIAVDDCEVFVTTGSSAGLLLAFLSAFNPGDRVALVSPGYPAYRNILRALDLEPVLLKVDSTHHYQPNADLLANCGRIRGLIVASPSNPTGSMIDPICLAELYHWCEEKEIRLISDETYHGITFDRPAESARGVGANAIVINSFSKYFSMTGWRLGWMIVPENLRRAVECLAQNFHICPPPLSQFAATVAFECIPELDRHVERYRHNRALLLEGLRRIGITNFAPSDGAFYLYPEVSHLTTDSLAFCKKLLDETGVALAPGIDFDPIDGKTAIRLCFAGSTEEIEEALACLSGWVGETCLS